MKNKKGFTLIELLVVIAIIGLLSTLAVVALNNARSKARDAKRLADIRQFQTALELYAVDNNGQYPADLTTGGHTPASNELGWDIEHVHSDGFKTTAVAPTFMAIVPKDPSGAANGTVCTLTQTNPCNPQYTSRNGLDNTKYGIYFRIEGNVAGFTGPDILCANEGGIVVAAGSNCL